MDDQERRIVIIGASAAGLRCASRLKRLKPDWLITVVEKSETFSFAACGLPYVLSGDIEKLEALRTTGDGTLRDESYFADVKGIEVMSGCTAASIDANSRTLHVTGSDGEKDLEYDELVIAAGARVKRLPGQPDHPRVRSFHTAEDLAPLHEGLAHGKIGTVVIIGAGFLGCELAEAFTAMWGAEVTLVETAPAPLPAILDEEIGAIVTKVMEKNDVVVKTGSAVDSIEASDEGVSVKCGKETFSGDVAVVALGVEPVVDLAEQAGIALGETGAIAVSDRMATNIPHIWAAGDCTEVVSAVTGAPKYLPLGSLANRQGRTLANILAGSGDRFPPVAGAAALKVFDCNVASVGITRVAALKLGHNARSVWTYAHDCADYWPESKNIAIHMVYETGTRKVLGVQVVGEGDVTKRVDVATQLILRGATIDEFAHIEHAYSPPYSPAMEPLAVAAMVAMNQETSVEAFSPCREYEQKTLVDVRNPDEQEARPAPGSDVRLISLNELRDKVGDIGEGKVCVICERGARSAEAVRLLTGKGIDAQYLGGGLRWQTRMGKPPQSP